MAKKRKNEIPEGEAPRVRIQTLPDQGPMAVGDRIMEAMPDNFRTIGEALASSAGPFFEALSNMHHPPTDIEMDLSLAVEASGNFVVVSGKANANATIKLVWKRK